MHLSKPTFHLLKNESKNLLLCYVFVYRKLDFVEYVIDFGVYLILKKSDKSYSSV